MCARNIIIEFLHLLLTFSGFTRTEANKIFKLIRYCHRLIIPKLFNDLLRGLSDAEQIKKITMGESIFYTAIELRKQGIIVTVKICNDEFWRR